MFIQRSGDYRRAFNARSHPHVGKYPAEDECVELYGILKGKVSTNDIRQTCKLKVQVWKQTFLVRGDIMSAR